MARKCDIPNDQDDLQATVPKASWVNPLLISFVYAPSHELFDRQIAFIKMYATRTAQETARDAVQIFGGRGITRTGMGRFIEHYHRTVTFDSLLGGAEGKLDSLLGYTRSPANWEIYRCLG